MKKRGQALVEFVLILPILVLILFIMVDLANIFFQKFHLENHLSYLMKVKNETEFEYYLATNDLVFEEKNQELIIKKEVNLFTPGLGNIIEKPYFVQTSGFIYEK